jgi:hypothetical protein
MLSGEDERRRKAILCSAGGGEGSKAKPSGFRAMSMWMSMGGVVIMVRERTGEVKGGGR